MVFKQEFKTFNIKTIFFWIKLMVLIIKFNYLMPIQYQENHMQIKNFYYLIHYSKIDFHYYKQTAINFIFTSFTINLKNILYY
jgi:hypothetical protein